MKGKGVSYMIGQKLGKWWLDTEKAAIQEKKDEKKQQKIDAKVDKIYKEILVELEEIEKEEQKQINNQNIIK